VDLKDSDKLARIARMRHLLEISWWMLAIRGGAAVLFGLLALAWPALTLLVLVLLFAVYTLTVGSLAVIASLKTRDEQGWWLVLLLGLASITIGIVALLYPRMTAVVLVLVMGAGALITGVIETWIAVRLRKEIRNEWFLGTAGAISILFGAFVLLSPGAGALALVWVIALQSIATGVLFVIIGLRVRSSADPHRQPTTHAH
jgi:uncharacterized membrane protein HdeD (DUF308 family)